MCAVCLAILMDANTAHNSQYVTLRKAVTDKDATYHLSSMGV